MILASLITLSAVEVAETPQTTETYLTGVLAVVHDGVLAVVLEAVLAAVLDSPVLPKNYPIEQYLSV